MNWPRSLVVAHSHLQTNYRYNSLRALRIFKNRHSGSKFRSFVFKNRCCLYGQIHVHIDSHLQITYNFRSNHYETIPHIRKGKLDYRITSSVDMWKVRPSVTIHSTCGLQQDEICNLTDYTSYIFSSKSTKKSMVQHCLAPCCLCSTQR